MAKIDTLRERAGALEDEIEKLRNAGEDPDSDLTDDELGTINAKFDELEKITAQIGALEKADRALTMSRGPGRRSSPDPQGAAPGAGGAGGDRVYPRARDPKAGFKNLGEFAMCVRAAATKDQAAHDRLLNATSVFGGENVGADGGYAVPPDFRNAIAIKIGAPESLLSRTDKLVTASNSITVPKDETTPWQTTGGIQAYWETEGGVKTPSKPLLEQNTIRLNKLTCLVPVSDELLEDAPGLDSYLRSKAPQKFIAKLNTAIISGDGVGKPLGILSSPSLVTVPRETVPANQGAATIIYPNIVKMWAALLGDWRRNAVWLINQDAESQLGFMDFRSNQAAPTTPIPVYLPGNTISGDGYATLKGRPVIPVEACSALGSLGDIILVDLTQYMTATKGQDIKTDVSIHLYFDQDLTTFRFVMRVAGQPWWSSVIAPQNTPGSNRSWAVTLAARP